MGEHMYKMLSGPGHLRFLVQPAVAALLGVLHGLREARLPRPAPAGVSAPPGGRAAKLEAWLNDIALPLSVALVASVAFQYLVLSRARLVWAVLFAAIFVAVPYFTLRLVTQLLVSARRRGRPAGPLRPTA
jgi:hypothetical protein